MKIKFCCFNPQCIHEGTDRYTVEIDQETWMDSQNIADMFCKSCGGTLKQCPEEECEQLENCA